MATYITLNSVEELDKLVADKTYVLIDFWATWCPPCKAIAPLFEKLASTNTFPESLAFAKVDVDKQKEITNRYGVSAMPTFILLEKGKVLETVKGANPGALRWVAKYAKDEIRKEKKEAGEDVPPEEEEEIIVDGPDNTWVDLKNMAVNFMTIFVVIFAVVYYLNHYGKGLFDI